MDLHHDLSSNPHAASMLGAVTDIIRQQLGVPSSVVPTAVQYFSALAATLLESGHAADVVGANLVLLAAVLPHVPQQLLRSHFDGISEAVVEDLVEMGGDDAGVAVPAVRCTGLLLAAQSKSAWSRPQTISTYNHVLAFTLDPRKEVHEEAQRVVAGLFGADKSIVRRIGEVTALFWQRMLDEETGQDQGALIISLAKELVGFLSAQHLDALCAAAMQAASGPKPAVHRVAWLLLDTVMSSAAAPVSASVVAKVVDVLFQSRPPLQDPGQMHVHIQVLASSVARLHALSPTLSAAVLKPTVDSLIRDFSAGNAGVTEAAESAIVRLVDVCVDDDAVSEAVHWTEMGTPDGTTPVVAAVVASICGRGLQTRYRSAWVSVVRLIDYLLTRLGAAAVHVMPTAIGAVFRMLAELSELDDEDVRARLRPALEQTLGTAMRVVGLPAFHAALPADYGVGLSMWTGIKESPDAAVGHPAVAMVVALMQHSAHHSSLQFFTDRVLPAAMAAKRRALELHGEGSLDHQALNHLAFQLFSLVTAFAVHPNDLQTAFPALAPQLGTIMSAVETTEWVPATCAALRSLVDLNRGGGVDGAKGDGQGARMRAFRDAADLDGADDEGSSDEDEGGKAAKHASDGAVDEATAAANTRTLATFARNYLPIFHNIIVNKAVPSSQRRVVLETLRSYAAIAPPALLRGFFGSALKGMLKVTTDVASAGREEMERVGELVFVRTAFADMIHVLVPALPPGAESASLLGLLWRALVPQLSDVDATFQKRSYHIFEALCVNQSEWIRANLAEIQASLASCLAACAPSARKARLRVIAAVMPLMGELEMVQRLLPEVLLCLKEPNRALKQGAMNLLADMADMWASGEGVDKYGEFVAMVAAGLAGRTPQMVSAAVIALTWLLFVLARSGNLPPEMPDQLIQTIAPLFGETSTPVVRAVLSFIKVCTVPDVVSPAVLQKHLPSFVPALLAWCRPSDDKARSRVSWRLQVRVIFERVLRRFEYDDLATLFPESDRRFLANINKEMQRKQRRKKEQRDTEMDVGEHATLIREANDGVDFADPSAARHMVSEAAASRKRLRDDDDSEDGFGDGVKERDDGRLEVWEAPTDDEMSAESDNDERPAKRGRGDGGAEAVGSGPRRMMSGKHWWRRRDRADEDTPIGQEFKAKRAGGDVSRPGGVQPYAYIPLGGVKKSGRRKEKKMASQLQGVIGGARRGAVKARKGGKRR